MAAGGKGSVRPRVEASAKWTAGGPAAAGDLVDWALRPGERIRHGYYTSMERQSSGGEHRQHRQARSTLQHRSSATRASGL